MSGSRQKLRAILLSFVMVVSIVGAGIAFSGTAAAAASNPTLSSTDVVEGEEVDVDATDDDNTGNDVYAILDVDGDGEYDQTGPDRVVSTGASGGTQEIGTFDTTNLDGDYDVYVQQGEPGDDTDISSQPSTTLSVTPLEVDITPSDAPYGDTVNLNVEVTADGEPYENNVYVGVFGLNSDDGNGENKVLKSASTTSGSYSTAITLDGVDDSGNLMGNYEVAVRNADSGGDFGSTGDNAPADDTKTANDLDATALLDGSPDVSVSSVTNTERGSSASISGSVVDYDGNAISGYEVDVRNLGAGNSLGTTDTAGNGDFATTETLEDAAEHAVTLNLFNGSIVSGGDSTEEVPFEQFNATANQGSASSDTDSFPARISETGTIDLTAEGADDGNNVTRFRLSGVELEDLDLAAGHGTDRIEAITYTDGSSDGSVSDAASAAAIDADIDGDSDDELDTATATDIETKDGVNIESVVIVADAGTTDADTGSAENTVDFTALAAESGTLTAEAQVEAVEDVAGIDANTPNNPDWVDTTSITVEEPEDLNVNLDPTSGEIDPDDDGNVEMNDLEISILDSNGLGLQESPNDDEIQSVTVSLTGNGTQFMADDANGYVDTADTDNDNDVELTSSQGNLDSTEFTADDGDLGADTQTFEVDSVVGEQNGTIDVSVTADVQGQSEDITGSATYTVTDSDIVSGLPSGEFTVGEEFDISTTITSAIDTFENSREITFEPAAADAFKVDANGDGDYVTGVDAIRLSGADSQAQLDTDDDGFADVDSSSSLSVNNGEYQLDNVNVTAAGTTVDVQVKEGTNDDLQANFPSQFSTSGESVYSISSDVDPLVAGYTEQVNLTVTNASGGEVTGTELNNLLDNDETADTITQEEADVSSAGADLAIGDAEDTNDDGTNDVIQVDITPLSTSQVNVSIDNGDGTETGSGAIDVVAPEVETNVENNVLTERLNQSVEVTAIDPRDGSRLASSDETADIRFTLHNGTVEIDDFDTALDATPDEDQTGSPSGDQYEFSDDGDQFSATDVANSNLSIAALPYDPDNEQFKLEIEVDSDAANFYGSTNLTVEPPQVVASPSSIELGSQQQLQVAAEDANGNALANRDVRLDGAVSTITGSTDSSGFVAVTVNPQATGAINVHTASDNDIETSGGDNSPAAIDASGSIEDTVNVTTEQSEFNVDVSPQTVTANQTSTVTVTANNNASGDAVEGASVTLSGAGVDTNQQTDANGEASFDVTASQSGTIDVTVNDAGFAEVTSTITVDPEPEPGAVQIDNVNLDPSSVTANTTNDHDLTFDALNVSADNSTDSFEVSLPSDTLDSANDVTVTTENVSAQNLAVNGDTITFDVNPDSEALSTDIAVETNVTVTAPDVSSTTDASIDINATDSDGSSDSQSATLTVTPADVELGTLDVSLSQQNVTANEEDDVTVTVTNASSGDAVEDASVSISDLELSDTTDADGEAVLTVNTSQTGQYTIDVSADGFEDASTTLTVQEDAPAYYTLKFPNSIADRDVQTTTISTFSTHRQSGSTALLPRSVYRYTRTHTGGLR